MKVTLLCFFTATLWISCHGEENSNPSPNGEKLPYKSFGFLSRISNYGLDSVNDSEDPTLVELQFLRKRDAFCIGEQVFDPIKNAVSELLGSATDVCEKDFSSVPIFSSKQIEIPKKAGVIEEKPIEIIRYNVQSPNFNFPLHKCACEIKGNASEESKSYCIDGSAYVTEGVNGSESYFILKKSDSSDNLNLRAQITLSGSPSPAETAAPATSAAPTAPATPATPAESTTPPVSTAPLHPPSS